MSMAHSWLLGQHNLYHPVLCNSAVPMERWEERSHQNSAVFGAATGRVCDWLKLAGGFKHIYIYIYIYHHNMLRAPIQKKHMIPQWLTWVFLEIKTMSVSLWFCVSSGWTWWQPGDGGTTEDPICQWLCASFPCFLQLFWQWPLTISLKGHWGKCCSVMEQLENRGKRVIKLMVKLIVKNTFTVSWLIFARGMRRLVDVACFESWWALFYFGTRAIP